MPNTASRGEGARNGKEHDLLVGPFLAGVVILRDSTGSYAGFLSRVGHVSKRFEYLRKAETVRAAYENTMPSGKLSPALSSGMLGGSADREEIGF